MEKPLNRQVGMSLVEPVFRFCVKFYAPDPAQLEEEFTRYVISVYIRVNIHTYNNRCCYRFLFCLQVKRDLANGILQCNDNTAAIMASYIVQGK